MATPGSRLSGRSALVTGAGRGLGREIALAYASEGAMLVLAARTMTEVQDVATEAKRAGVRAIAVQADVSVESDVRELVDRAEDEFGRIDILVNNAGITPGAADGPIRSLLDVSPIFWDRSFAVNCRGPFLLMRAAIPGMVARGGGTILAITSRLARTSMPGNAPYGPSKAALELLTLIVDTEFSMHGIRANLLHPGGPVATSIFTDFYRPSSDLELGHPSIIREPAVWLASHESSRVHGIVVDAREWNSAESDWGSKA